MAEKIGVSGSDLCLLRRQLKVVLAKVTEEGADVDKEWCVGGNAELIQAIESFHFIDLVKVISNEPEQAGESFWAGFTVVYGASNLREEVV